ncbi:tRNA pseudouridine(38-40) synthase TruA [Paracoccaceae bacterium GXU_MW_L88]
MPRFALKIEYHGKPFHGWQRQASGLPTVQAAVEAALAKLEPDLPSLAAAGRTDTGVHATGQVAHIDLAKDWDSARLMGALNHHLRPHPVAITAAAEVGEDFHARFSATGRRYLFRLIARRAPLVHEAGLVWQIGHELDLGAMRQGAAHLTGRHDFTTFRAVMCQAKSPVKSLDEVEIEAFRNAGGMEYHFHFAAPSFLHNQVRSMVGTLERVGAGSWTPEDVRTALEAQDRAACGPVCPPEGLYLTHVTYSVDPFENAAPSGG